MEQFQTDVRIRRVTPYYPFVRARTPLKFGAVVVEATDFCHVCVEVENRRGAVAEGWGAMFLMDMWSWPSPIVDHEQRVDAMRRVNGRLCELFAACDDFAHPVDVFHRLEADMRKVAEEVSSEMQLAESVPYLATLVCASPIDAAVHDAFGNVNGIETYAGYGRKHMACDLSAYLGQEFAGAYVADFMRENTPTLVPAFHLVGGLDKLRESEITDDDPQDGLPVSLDQWIRYDRLHCLKVKLKGTDVDWDLDRLCEVAAIAHEEHEQFRLRGLYFSADTNEQCENPEYCIELLRRLQECDPRTYKELLYLEQPTERDLRAHKFDMRELAKLKPVIIDESLMTLGDFELAVELGWSGIALKACKCQSAAVVFASKAEQMGIPYMVQDLTNPGIALIQSVGIAAHFNTLKGVEANSRQFFPEASTAEARVHPGMFKLTEGCIDASTVWGTGLGYRWSEIGRTFSTDEENPTTEKPIT